MSIEISPPKVGRRRLICTASLCTTATTLWIAAPAYLPFADVSALMVLDGVAIPFGVGWVTLLLMERKIARDLKRVEHRPLPEHDREEVAAR